MSQIYAYFMDLFKPVNTNFDKLVEIFEEDELKPFELVRDFVEEYVDKDYEVKFYAYYFNPKTMTLVIEYFINYKNGTISLKIIHARNPQKALQEYYEAEKGDLLHFKKTRD